MDFRKVVSLFFMILTWAVSCVVLGLGIWTFVNPFGIVGEYVSVAVPIICISLGSAIAITALVGVYATFKDDDKILRLFSGSQSILLMASLILMVVGFFYEYTSRSTIPAIWAKLYTSDPALLEKTERKFKCCGLNTVDDMVVPKPSKLGLPSLCVTDTSDFGFDRPCFSFIVNQFDQELLLIMSSMAVLALIMVGSLASAFTQYSKSAPFRGRHSHEADRLLG